jgi:WD40 repeat protein
MSIGISVVVLLAATGVATVSAQTSTVGEVTGAPELVLETGHTSRVNRVAYGPDGRWIASGGINSEVKIWDAATGRELRTLWSARDQFSEGLGISPDGTRLVAGGDNDVVVWDVATGREVHRLIGHTNRVVAVRFGSDARTVISFSPGVIKVWDAASGREIRTFTNPFAAWTAVSPDGRLAASAVAARGGSVKVVELATGRELYTLSHGVRARPSSGAAPPSRERRGFFESLLGLPAGRSGEPGLPSASSPAVAASTMSVLAFSPDGRFLATAAGARAGGNATGLVRASDGYTIRMWDMSTGREVRTIAEGVPDVHGLAVSPDGRWIAAASGVYDMPAAMPSSRERPERANVVTVWEVATGREMRTLAHPKRVAAVAFSPDSRALTSGGDDETVRVWDLDTGRMVRTLGRFSGLGSLSTLSPDGRWLVLASDNTLKLWELRRGQGPRVLRGHGSGILAAAFSSDSRVLATGGAGNMIYPGGDTSIKLWDVTTGRELRTLAGHTRMIRHLSFSPDGRVLVSGSGDNTLRLWEVATGRELHILAHSPFKVPDAVKSMPDMDHLAMRGGVTALAHSLDGRLLASTGADRLVKVWDIASGRQLHSFSVAGADPKDYLAQADFVSSIAFSPDARVLAAGLGMDNVIRRWDVETGQELPSLTWGQSRAAALQQEAKAKGKGPTTPVWREASESVQSAQTQTDIGMRGITSIAFSPDGSGFATVGRDGTVKVWDSAAAREVRTFHTELGGGGVVFTPSGDRVVYASNAGQVRAWNLDPSRRLQPERRRAVVHGAVDIPADERWFYSSGHGSILVWEAATGRLRATLVAGGDSDEWVVVTPDGLFDGSPAAWNRVLWRFGQQTFEFGAVELFFNEFFHPGVLVDVLAGKNPRARRDISQIDRRQPAVTLTLPRGHVADDGTVASRTVTAQIEVEEARSNDRPRASGVRDVRLFRNGSLIRVWRGDIALGTDGKAVLQAEVPMVAGENRLTAYAFNRDNVKSSDAVRRVTGVQALRRQGHLHVLTVGINTYANADYKLRYAVADATALGEELRRQQVKLGGFARVEVVPLLDRHATKANILWALQRLAGTASSAAPAGAPAALAALRPAEPEDAVVVYFAGHGTAQGARFYLLPHDLGYAGRRTQLDAAGLRTIVARSISDVEMEHAFERVDAGRMVLIIDACNSGQALEAEEKRRGPMNSKGLAQLAYEKGMYVLTAAQSYQAALEAGQFGHGLLTYALVEEALKTPVADIDPPDGQVVVREWLDHPARRVPELQQTVMRDAQRQGRDVVFVAGEENIPELENRSLQHPRVFYRREPDVDPFVVAHPEGAR